MRGAKRFRATPPRGAIVRRVALGLLAWAAVLAGGAVPLQAQISGYVIDATTQQLLPGARVGIQASDMTTTTDASGRFSLVDVPPGIHIVTAAHVGYFTGSARVIGSAPNVGIALEAVPQENHPDYEFRDPTTCSLCHIVQLEQWSDSPMARAGRNTWLYDVYDGSGTPGGHGGFVYTRDSHLADTNPSSECASCHQPERWIEQPHVALEDLETLSRASIHGVSCEVCHKMADIDESRKNTPGIWPGVVTMTRPAPGSSQVMYGVLGDVDYHTGGMRASYQPQLVAAACCACHQDKNDPDDDGVFEEDNGIVSEPTYNEWLATPYADVDGPQYRSCVDCHMPAYGDSLVCRVMNLVRPSHTIRSHRIEGTTPQYLESAVTLSLTVDDAEPDSLRVQVSLHNDGAGHHVPTGVSIRNIILVVEAWDLSSGETLQHLGGQTVHELAGVGDPLEGDYAGLAGKLYGKITAGPDGASPVFFTEAVTVVADTRLPALAMDTTSYVFRRDASAGVTQVRARLIYRRAWRALVRQKGWTRTGHGDPLADIQPPHFGHLMEQAVWSSAAAYVHDFGATIQGEGVLLTWDVEASLRHLQGFRVLRSVRGSAPEPLHAGLLPFTQRQFVDTDTRAGQPYDYHLRLVLVDGGEIEAPLASAFTPSAVAALEPNHPNPFNPGTTLAYVVPEGGARVVLSIHDVRGRHVRTLVQGFEAGGRRLLGWDGTDDRGVRLASGLYVARLQADDEVHTQRMMLVK